MGNRERLNRLRYLMQQLALPSAHRDPDLGPSLRTVRFDINVVLSGVSAGGNFHPTRCCLIGAAMLDQKLAVSGLTRSEPFLQDGETELSCAPVLHGTEVSVSSRRIAEWLQVSLDLYRDIVLPASYYQDTDGDQADPTPKDVIRRIDAVLATNPLIA